MSNQEKRINKTKKEQEVFYKIPDLYEFIILCWANKKSNEAKILYEELSNFEQYYFISYLLDKEPFDDWKNLVKFLVIKFGL